LASLFGLSLKLQNQQMKKLHFILAIFFAGSIHGQQLLELPPGSAAFIYQLPDTLKAVQYYSEVTAEPFIGYSFYGSYFSEGMLGLVSDKTKKGSIVFSLNNADKKNCRLVAMGLNVETTKDWPYGKTAVKWKYEWQQKETYKFLLTVVADSASQSTYYTGYVFLAKEQQWKLLASFQKMNDGNYIKQPGNMVSSFNPRMDLQNRKLSSQQAWVQRENGSWKEMDGGLFYNATLNAGAGIEKVGGIFIETQSEKSMMPDAAPIKGLGGHTRPTIDLTRHIDSLEQLNIDLQEMNAAVQSGKIDTTDSKENVYYKILKEGTGDFVNVSDTVTAFYKGSLLKDGSVFDSTKEKPAVFPLKRLIKGWQVGVPLIKAGGKIRLYIPSSLAYSIRSRSKDIPPNSVLVFDVEVVGVKK
jgi:hypothetical protein